MELINLDELYNRCGYEDGNKPDVKYPLIAVAHIIGELLEGMGYTQESLAKIIGITEAMGKISCDVELENGVKILGSQTRSHIENLPMSAALLHVLRENAKEQGSDDGRVELDMDNLISTIWA